MSAPASTATTRVVTTASAAEADRPDRRAARRQATRDEIVAAAWELVREKGLAGLSLRDLAARVGLKAPSLYSYFDSKHAIYDAMFMEGYLAFEAGWERLAAEATEDPAALEGIDLLRTMATRYVEFCTDDPARFQLLFQRTIPDFEPSPESYAVAERVLAAAAERFGAIGITDPGSVDLWTALLSGLASQQIANDPGGDRWSRRIDEAVEMFAAARAPHLITTITRSQP